MDSDLGARLEAVLSDPEQMEKIAQVAQGLFAQTGGQVKPPETDPPQRQEGPSVPPADARFLSALGRAFSGGGEASRSTALLTAMRPYMKPEKQEKLDRAMEIARMARIAGAVVKQYGDGHGL